MISIRPFGRLLPWMALLLMTSAVAGCTDNGAAAGEDAKWGPLTVIDGDPLQGGQALIGEGPLRIDDCVTIDVGPREVLLVWKAGQTAWDPEQSIIRFTNYDGTQLELRDGDAVIAGGVGVGAEGAHLPDDLVADPAPSCPTDAAVLESLTIAPG